MSLIDSIASCQATIARLKAKRFYLSQAEFDCGLRIQQLIKEQSETEDELMMWEVYLIGLQKTHTMNGSDSQWDRLRKRLCA